MRYYGMSSGSNSATQRSPMNAAPDLMEPPIMTPQQSALETPQSLDTDMQTAQMSESRTFNRPPAQNGIYKGQSNALEMPQSLDRDTQTTQMSESRTFNRPSAQNGIYKGQRAQNVRPISEWLEELPPAVMPPGSNPEAMGMDNATVYEYPAPEPKPEYAERTCPSEMGSVSYLCAHRGRFVRVEMGLNTEKSGILKTVGRNYIVLQESDSNNLIMCALSSVKAINIYK